MFVCTIIKDRNRTGSYSEFHAQSDNQTVPLEAGGIQFKLSSWRMVVTILSLIGHVELVFVPALGNKFRSFVQESNLSADSMQSFSVRQIAA